MPANGNVGESAAAVASPRRQEAHMEPLKRRGERIVLLELSISRIEAIVLASIHVVIRL